MSSNSRDLGRLTASWTLEKCGIATLGARAVNSAAGGGIQGVYKGLTNPNPTNNRPGSFLNPGGVQPGGGGALPGTQQQRQQAMQNPVSRQQYIQQAKQQEQQRMAGKGIDNTPGSPAMAAMRGGIGGVAGAVGSANKAVGKGVRTAFNASPAGAAYSSLTNPNPTNNRPGGFLNPGGVRPGGPTFRE